MLDKILYVDGKIDMTLKLLHSVLSPFIEICTRSYNDPFFPILRQLLLIPNRNNKFVDFIANYFYPPPYLILLGFDQYL